MHPSTHHPFFPLVVCAIIVSLFFLFFYPPIHVSIDEHQYLKNALLIQKGELKDANPLLYCGGTYKGDAYLSSYHVGKSISLIPFTWGSFPWAMLAGLLIHLLNMVFFALILRKLNIHPWFVGLFAFYPALVWESRTLFSETFALTLLLGGVLAYVYHHPRMLFLSGILFGLAAFVRYETILISAGFGIALIWKERHTILKWGRSPAPFFVLGGILSALLLLTWNAWYNGNPFSTQIGSPSYVFTSFPSALFLPNLLFLLGILLIAFPLMIAIVWRFKPLRLEFALATLFTLFLFSQTSNVSVFPFLSPLTLTARMRYLIPLAGLLLIAYAGVLSSFIPTIRNRIGNANLHRFAALVGIVFLIGTFGLSMMHQGLLEKRAIVSEQLISTIPDGSLVVGSADDCVYFLPLLSGSRAYVKVNDPSQDIPALISSYAAPVYVVKLKYANASDSDVRQDVIDRERVVMENFIKENTSNLTLVFDTNAPHHLAIYEWK
jgi:preprotein translocase subunit SecG